MFVEGEPEEAGRTWCADRSAALEGEYPMVQGFHLGLHPLARLQSEPFWRFILRYNSIRLQGRDLIAELERSGIHTPAPTKALAKSRVAWMRSNLDAAVSGEIPPTLFPHLPADPFLITRKLARNFVVVEGAHVLMATGDFVGFSSRQVLQRLAERHGQWRGVVELTRTVLRDPLGAAVDPETFMARIAAFCQWSIDQVGAAGVDPGDGA